MEGMLERYDDSPNSTVENEQVRARPDNGHRHAVGLRLGRDPYEIFLRPRENENIRGPAHAVGEVRG